MMRLHRGLCYEYLKILIVVAAYWVISISTVFVNKTLLKSQDGFDAPMFVAWFQCFFTALVCFGLKRLSMVTDKWGLAEYPKNPFSAKLLVKILPLSIVFTCMVGFNNLCLKYVGVAFYYLARSLTTVTNVVFTFTILRQKVSFPALMCCLVITGGYMLGLEEEGSGGANLTFVGVFYGVLSSCFVSLNAIYTKKVLPWVDNSSWELMLYNNVNASILFVVFSVLWGEFPNRIFVPLITDAHFWFLMVIGGFCGISIGLITAMQIKLTSPLTHNISGTAKACVQTLIAVWVFPEFKSWTWWASNWIVLGGSGLYTRVQQLDMEKAYRKPKATLPVRSKDKADPSREKLVPVEDDEDGSDDFEKV